MPVGHALHPDQLELQSVTEMFYSGQSKQKRRFIQIKAGIFETLMQATLGLLRHDESPCHNQVCLGKGVGSALPCCFEGEVTKWLVDQWDLSRKQLLSHWFKIFTKNYHKSKYFGWFSLQLG